MLSSQAIFARLFQLTPSRRATTCCWYIRSVDCNFNSRPHGGRQSSSFILLPQRKFQLTPSRRATWKLMIIWLASIFQLTPSRRATRAEAGAGRRFFISTHALTEGDKNVKSYDNRIFYFNSRPHGGRPTLKYNGKDYAIISTHALTEGDLNGVSCGYGITLFQLTPSRRATDRRLFRRQPPLDFNSRPHGGRP